MKLNAKQITLAALLLAICVASQFFKNLSVYVTGPVINTALILTTIYCGFICGIFLSIITPITSFIITGSPVMAAVPQLFPCIILGNIVLILSVFLLKNIFKGKITCIIPMIIGSTLKGIAMGILIAGIVLPIYLPEKMNSMLKVLQTQFSVTQFITAMIGSIIAYIIVRLFGQNINKIKN